MKRYFTGQDGAIATYGLSFSAFIYDTFWLDSHFRLNEVHFPPFEGMTSKRVYQRMLLAWMIEEAPDCIERIGSRIYHIKTGDSNETRR